MLETSVRMLQLLALLQSRRDCSGADLANRLGVTSRTVRNDIERLRIMGYEVHSSTGVTGGYRLGAGTAIPPLLLDDEEAVAGACRDHAQLRFDYLAREGEASVRHVEPHRLVYTGRRWYLLAWDIDRGDWRTFRADRIQPRLPTGPRFTPREPPEDAASHVMRGVGSLAWKHQARIRFPAPLEVVAERLPPEAGRLRPIDDKSCMLETGSDSLHDLVGYLTRLDLDFEALDPPELQRSLRRLADRYAAAAGPGRRAKTSAPE